MLSLFGTSSSSSSVNYYYKNSLAAAACLNIGNLKQRRSFSPPSKISSDGIPNLPSSPSALHRHGLCKASQVAELFPSEIAIREARIEDFWEVAETHCSSFFPGYSFPFDFMLRLNRFTAMLFSNPAKGFERACLVAVVEGYDRKFSPPNKARVAGILTIDNLADFLPRKGPLKQRRKWIAYVSNVAVRDEYRRKGIAKKMIAEAEAKATSWECRAIALHCDLRNFGAVELYSGQGFRSVRVPKGADWPRPRSSRDVQYNFMMKLVRRRGL